MLDRIPSSRPWYFHDPAWEDDPHDDGTWPPDGEEEDPEEEDEDGEKE